VVPDGDFVLLLGLVVGDGDSGAENLASIVTHTKSVSSMCAIMRLSLAPLLCAIFLVCGIEHIPAKAQSPQAATKPVIVSQTHPKDSQGETVYDEQDAAQANAPVVPGVLVHPEFLKTVKPKIPMSARMHHRKVNIVIEGVVTAKGDVIDVHVLHDDGEPSLAENCAKALRANKFKPATLDGKPVAVLLQVPFSFNVF
jgi:hypothetical protein